MLEPGRGDYALIGVLLWQRVVLFEDDLYFICGRLPFVCRNDGFRSVEDRWRVRTADLEVGARLRRQWILSQAKLVRPRNASLRRPREARMTGRMSEIVLLAVGVSSALLRQYLNVVE